MYSIPLSFDQPPRAHLNKAIVFVPSRCTSIVTVLEYKVPIAHEFADWLLYLIQSLGKRSIREQIFHVDLRVTVALSGVGLVRNLSYSLGILRGKPNIPTVHILFEVLRR